MCKSSSNVVLVSQQCRQRSYNKVSLFLFVSFIFIFAVMDSTQTEIPIFL